MSVRHLVGGAAVAAAVFLASSAVYSQDGAESTGGAAPSEEEICRLMAERAAPGEEHARLAELVGTWDAEVTCTGGGAEQKSRGTIATESLLGGRVLLSRFRGEMAGQPFEGVEIRGFDKQKGRHWAVWSDTMSTASLRFSGTRGADGHVAMTSDEFDCMGTTCVGRAVTRTIDRDHYEFEMASAAGDQTVGSVKIRYTRRK